jgi:hypothetical protein
LASPRGSANVRSNALSAAAAVFVVLIGIKNEKSACTPQFSCPQPRCREVFRVLSLHPHYSQKLQNRTPACNRYKKKTCINIIIIINQSSSSDHQQHNHGTMREKQLGRET